MDTLSSRKKHKDGTSSTPDCYGFIELDELRILLDWTNSRLETIQPDRDTLFERQFLAHRVDLQSPGFRHVVKSIDLFDARLRSAKKDLVELGDGLQKVIDARVVATRTGPTMFSLPNEILREIFRHNKKLSPKDIQSLRLTCRRFCDMSSGFLLDKVIINLSQESLKRLEDISNHPTIKKGVKSVRLNLDYHGSNLAQDEQIFAQYCADRLQEALVTWRRNWYCRELDLRRKFDSAKQDLELRLQMDLDKLGEDELETTMKATELLSSWRNAVESGFLEQDVQHALLRRTFKEYQSRHASQQTLLQHSACTIATAMAKMPLARHLSMGDVGRHPRPEDPNEIVTSDTDHPDVIFEKLLAPWRNWSYAEDFGIGPPPVDLLIQLPLAAHEAGVELLGLKVRLSTSQDILTLSLAGGVCGKLQAATSRLELFEFSSADYAEHDTWDLRPPGYYKNFWDYLSSLIASKSMKRLLFDFDLMGGEPWQPESSMGHLFAAHKWPDLRFFTFHGPFQIGELETLLNKCFVERQVQVDLRGYLITGTWEAVLDTLRGRVPVGSCIDYEAIIGGGDWEDMSWAERKYAFKGVDPYLENMMKSDGRATEYIMGRYAKNPIREVHEGRPTLDLGTDDEM